MVETGRALGAFVGALVALAALATLVGRPWQYSNGGIAVLILRGGGSLLAAAIGVGLVVLAVRAQ